MNRNWIKLTATIAIGLWITQSASAQDHHDHDHAGHEHAGHDHADHDHAHGDHSHDHAGHDHEHEYDPASMPGMTPEIMKWIEQNKKNHANPRTPGPAHKELQRFVGNWDVTVKTWMGGPGSPVSESKGTAKIESILNGLFIREHMQFKLSMGPGMEMDFEGWGTAGYDNYKNMYVGTWCDNMGTQIFQYSGKKNPETGKYTYYGQMDEPMLAVAGRTVKMTTTVKDDDSHVFEWVDLHAGDDYKVMEITYKRKK